jgi:hypothetical protein
VIFLLVTFPSISVGDLSVLLAEKKIEFAFDLTSLGEKIPAYWSGQNRASRTERKIY